MDLIQITPIMFYAPPVNVYHIFRSSDAEEIDTPELRAGARNATGRKGEKCFGPPDRLPYGRRGNVLQRQNVSVYISGTERINCGTGGYGMSNAGSALKWAEVETHPDVLCRLINQIQ